MHVCVDSFVDNISLTPTLSHWEREDCIVPLLCKEGRGEVERFLGENRAGLLIPGQPRQDDSTPPNLPLQKGGKERKNRAGLLMPGQPCQDDSTPLGLPLQRGGKEHSH